MSETTTPSFDQQFLETWTATDPAARRAAIERVWAPEGRMVVSPVGAELQGFDQIEAFVAKVNAENIVDKGLEVLFRDGDGKVTAAYVFLGVD
jgi:hypothetical protein